jgi:hypothetical protein
MPIDCLSLLIPLWISFVALSALWISAECALDDDVRGIEIVRHTAALLIAVPTAVYILLRLL